jgi:hypothetical protein
MQQITRETGVFKGAPSRTHRSLYGIFSWLPWRIRTSSEELCQDQPGTSATYGVQINGLISNQFQHGGCDV